MKNNLNIWNEINTLHPGRATSVHTAYEKICPLDELCQIVLAKPLANSMNLDPSPSPSNSGDKSPNSPSSPPSYPIE